MSSWISGVHRAFAALVAARRAARTKQTIRSGSMRPALESLEDRLTPATSFHLDLNTTVSPTESGTTHVPLVQYAASRGYGWTNLSGMSATDRSFSDLLARDFHSGVDSTFHVDLPAGSYDLRVILGDASALRDQVSVYANGTLLASNITTQAGQFARPAFKVDVGSNGLDLRLVDTGGASTTFALGGIDISPAPVASAGPTRTVQAGVPITLAGSATSSSSEYKWTDFYWWNFGDGTSASGTLTPTHTYANPGTYTANLTVTDALGIQSVSSTTIIVTPTAATSVYVSKSGNDSNNGSSPTSAFQTISAAMYALAPGGTLYIEGGTYYERVVTRVNGSDSQPITITSYNGQAVIDGSTQLWVPGADQNLGMLELRNSNIIVKNLKIVNSKNTGIILAADNLTVTDTEIAFSARHAISTDTNWQPTANGKLIRNITLVYNWVHDNVTLGQGFGQAISLIADGFYLDGNQIWNNRTEGIDIWLGAKHGQVVNNTVAGNGSAGIFIDGASYVRIDRNKVFNNGRGIGISSEDSRYSTHDIWVYNNLIYNNSGAGLFTWDDPVHFGYRGVQNVLWANNTLVNNTSNMYLFGDSNTIQILNNLMVTTGSQFWSDATNTTVTWTKNIYLTDLNSFVSPSSNDYRLKSSASLAINQGTPLPVLWDDLGRSFTIGIDLAGNNRVLGSAIDIGAYETQ